MTRPAAPHGRASPARGAFVRRQQRDWIVTVVRTSLDRLAYQIVFPYLSIYIVALGASATQLGLVNSLGLVAAGLASPFVGWLIDRHGPRSFYLAGIGLLAVSYLAYALAGSWVMAIGAMVAYWLGYSISGHSCATICGNCLVNRDRATAMMVCETVGAGLLGIVGPLVGALIVASSGTVDPAAIRPAVRHRLRDQRRHLRHRADPAVAASAGRAASARRRVLRRPPRGAPRAPSRGRWLAIAAVGQLPVGMVFAFSQVYAHEVKGADAVVLGAMAAATAARLDRARHPARAGSPTGSAASGSCSSRPRSSASRTSCCLGADAGLPRRRGRPPGVLLPRRPDAGRDGARARAGRARWGAGSGSRGSSACCWAP